MPSVPVVSACSSKRSSRTGVQQTELVAQQTLKMFQEYHDFDDTMKMVPVMPRTEYNLSLASAFFQLASGSGALPAALPTSSESSPFSEALAREDVEETELVPNQPDECVYPCQTWTGLITRDSTQESSVSTPADQESSPFSWIEYSSVDESLAAETFGSTYNDTSDEESDSCDSGSVYEFFDDVSVLTADSTMEAIEVKEGYLEPEERDFVCEQETNINENYGDEDEPTTLPESLFHQAHREDHTDSFQLDLHLILEDRPATHHATDDFLLMSFLVNFCAETGR